MLTALRNPAMPLVRYRVGDRGRLATEPCRCGLPLPVLTDLQARAQDVFLAEDGSRRHGSELVNGLEEFFRNPVSSGVRQVLVRDDTLRWRVLIGGGETASRKTAAELLVAIVRRVAGAGCQVATENVLGIPRARGKFRYYQLK